MRRLAAALVRYRQSVCVEERADGVILRSEAPGCHPEERSDEGSLSLEAVELPWRESDPSVAALLQDDDVAAALLQDDDASLRSFRMTRWPLAPSG